MQIIKQSEKNIPEIIKILEAGGLVVFPCETVYGIAVDCLNSNAVLKLNDYKQRPLGKPYAIMVNARVMAEDYVILNDAAKQLYKNFLPGPLTVISKGKHKLVKGIESESGNLGIRIPDYPYVLKIISSFGRPIVATSANSSYKKRPYKITDILENISEKQKGLIDLIIDAGELPHNEPSTVIDTTLDDTTVLRQGTITINNKLSVVSYSEEQTRNTGKELWQKYEQYAGKRAIIFALEGPMGAGKTQFTKGLGKAMGIAEEIVSPTFNLELDYGNLKHFDAWRLENGQELENLGLKGYINDKSIIVIEWADRVVETIRKYNEEAVVIWVNIIYGKETNERSISWGVV